MKALIFWVFKNTKPGGPVLGRNLVSVIRIAPAFSRPWRSAAQLRTDQTVPPRELTETQAAAGFCIADIYRSGDSEDSLDDRRGVAAASEPINPRTAPDRIVLDRLLSEYPPKVREAAIELCVF